MLTPSDIEQKTFHTSLRGYNLDEVDDFLDEVVATVRDLHDRIDAGPVASGEEGAVGKALITAQATADQILADAREEAEALVGEARREAESWAAERDARRAETSEEVAELSRRVAEMRAQLSMLAAKVADRLDDMDRALDIQPSAQPESAAPTEAGDADPDPEVIEAQDLWRDDLG